MRRRMQPIAAAMCLVTIVGAAPPGPPSVVAQSGDRRAEASAATAASPTNAEVEQVLSGMSQSQKVGQLLVSGFAGQTADASARALVESLHLGGVLLMGRNVQDPTQVRSLTTDLQATTPDLPLLVAVDHEGGSVTRFRSPVTQLPSACIVGVAADAALAAGAGRVAARELLAMGVNVNLAPVLDVNNNPANPVIGVRSFGPDPDLVSRLGVAYIEALQAEGVLAVGKHFPGHGNTTVDSHSSLPIVSSSREELERTELVPFRRAIEGGLGGVMSAHVVYTALDPARPATLSHTILTDLIRGEMGFTGLIFTDSITMGAITASLSPGEGAVQAFLAGADLILMTGGANEVHAALLDAVATGRISPERLDDSVSRVVGYKLAQRDRWRQAPSLSEVGSEEHQALAASIVERAEAVPDITSPTVAFKAPRIVATGMLSPAAVAVEIAWTGLDDHCAPPVYNLKRRTDAGTWSPVNLPTTVSNRITLPVAVNHTHAFRITATDPSGNASPWVASAPLKPTLVEEDESGVRYVGPWETRAGSLASGGTVSRARSPGATASISFTGTSIAWVAPRGPTRGAAAITVDGGRSVVVDLYASTSRARQIVFRRSWPSSSAHELTIRVIGTPGRPVVPVDAFLILP